MKIIWFFDNLSGTIKYKVASLGGVTLRVFDTEEEAKAWVENN